LRAAEDQPGGVGHCAEIGAQVNGVRAQQQQDDAGEQPVRTMLPQIAGKAAAGGSPDPGAHDLHRGHQRIGEQHGPGEAVTELRASLRVGRDAARIVIRGARDQTGTQHPKQPGPGRFHDGLESRSAGCSISRVIIFACSSDPAACRYLCWSTLKKYGVVMRMLK